MDLTTVTTVQAKWVEKLPALRFGRSWVILTLAMLVFFAPVAAIAYRIKGPEALSAAAVAAGVCWFGSTLALAGTAAFGRSGINGPLYTLAFGMLFNCGLPFIVGLALYRSGGALARAGVFGLIVIFFQFALVVSTVLSLCLIKPARTPD
jgi:hypothetical protein